MRRKPVVTLVVTMVAVLMVLFAVERASSLDWPTWGLESER